MTIEVLLGGVGVLLMLAALSVDVASLSAGMRQPVQAREGRLRHARLRLGSFVLVFLGAGIFVLGQRAEYATPAAIGLFMLALLALVLTLGVRAGR